MIAPSSGVDAAPGTKCSEPCGALHCAVQPCSECEIKLEGEGPWRLPDGGSDVEILLTAGHTAGHVSLLYKNSASPADNTCFSGDHLAFTASGGLTIMRQALGPLSEIGCQPDTDRQKGLAVPDMREMVGYCCRGYNWHSVSMQLQSVHKLRDLNFIHLLPGHGRPGKFKDDTDRMEQVDSLLAREEYSAPKRQGPAVLTR